MADIFLSYSRQDLERAKRLVRVLKTHGWSVWWDQSILTGKPFPQVIGEALKAARCVVVLWSKTSIDSSWVCREAHRGLEQDILFPVLIDDVEVPFEFKLHQAANLVGWDRGEERPDIDSLLDGIDRLLGPSSKAFEEKRPRMAEADAARKVDEREAVAGAEGEAAPLSDRSRQSDHNAQSAFVLGDYAVQIMSTGFSTEQVSRMIELMRELPGLPSTWQGSHFLDYLGSRDFPRLTELLGEDASTLVMGSFLAGSSHRFLQNTLRDHFESTTQDHLSHFTNQFHRDLEKLGAHDELLQTSSSLMNRISPKIAPAELERVLADLDGFVVDRLLPWLLNIG